MSDPTTPEGRAELRRLLGSGFTDQPWAIWHDLDHQGFKTIGDEAGVLSDGKPFTEECNPFAHVYTDDLADLIVAAVTALPALLDALDQADAELAGYRAEEQRVRAWNALVNEGNVRCTDCGLRYAEREEYSCGDERHQGVHYYDPEELVEARRRALEGEP
ncbi:hypothetical protein [Rhodococcus sp. LW-XY12]|uniref:hypothetical protein n=1 Tax=Rhodococcus sp. LW-XY12 TaxID=2856851 RepID=UPI001C571B99|nr:hypothetical protein [Rhodococcus sp. LW-XY12]QXU53636.1 hypothetical protein KXC42_23415 [Rhodococcus sp. LW-XY12]